MEILHHGAVRGVTGSCHELVFKDGRSLLIDCGMFQGDEAEGRTDAFSFPVDRVVGLIVTHVHFDHIGRLPYLIAEGFRGPIYCSRPSAAMLPLVLEDALKVGVTRDERLIESFLQRVEKQLVPLSFDIEHVLNEYASLTLRRAGHILGSAYVELDVGDGEKQRVVFSGDLGTKDAPLLRAPASPERADILVLESTYGGRTHEGRKQRCHTLRRIIERALLNQGTVIIPAFSIGRTQEILYELEQIKFQYGASDPRWRDLAVIVDSPLAARFTEVYRGLQSYWDDEALGRVESGRHPLSFDGCLTVDSHAAHSKIVHHLAASARPCVVLAASGMCQGGRVVNYLKALLGDHRTDILFVGYQSEGTIGRRLLAGERQVYIDGEAYRVDAQIHQIGGFSAHADQGDLLDFVTGMSVPPTEIRLVHGSRGAKQKLREVLLSHLPNAHVVIPKSERADRQ